MIMEKDLPLNDMKRIWLFIFSVFITLAGFSQQTGKDSVVMVVVNKDPRIEVLGKKMAEYNESLANKLHSTKGYRLMLLSTSDRSQVLQVRSQLLQLFPEQSCYMVFQSPFIKLKFGNFLSRDEAEDYRKQLMALKIVAGNIYIVPEMVEVKAEKILAQQDN